ncbi:hypothetical protein [Pseudarthrobacter sp. SSS035]|uniref:hypothetical protein n=1 Tax=Pseudarthrobacter sp. SSS035 TaxID=2931399 RepID=UPI00200BDD34|nr:hypothetical protein [Pseudarthrobacter sp. SSS035]
MAVFAIFTGTVRDANSKALLGALVESLAQQLALTGMPITTVQSSVLNAELIFRGSQIKDSPGPHPPPTEPLHPISSPTSKLTSSPS